MHGIMNCEVNDNSTGKDAENEFSGNTAATTVEASNVQVRTNAALDPQRTSRILKAHNSLILQLFSVLALSPSL
jgi:hypothetical protein